MMDGWTSVTPLNPLPAKLAAAALRVLVKQRR